MPTTDEPTGVPVTSMPSTTPTMKPTDECPCFILEQMDGTAVSESGTYVDIIMLVDKSTSIKPEDFTSFMNAIADAFENVANTNNRDYVRLGLALFATTQEEIVTAIKKTFDGVNHYKCFVLLRHTN